MALSFIQRVRIILDLLKDGVVASEAAYSSVDLIDSATGLKYVDAILEVYDNISPVPPRVTIEDELAAMATAEKGRRYINTLRRIHIEALKTSRVPQVSRAAGDAESVSIDSSSVTEVGVSE